jgi:hypothetical protein
MYATPLVTIGVAAIEPKLGPDGTSAAGSLNVHACCKLAILADEIVEPGASRVFSASPFGYGHEPAGLAALGFVTVVGASALELVQAAAATPTAKSAVAPKYARAVIRWLLEQRAEHVSGG